MGREKHFDSDNSDNPSVDLDADSNSGNIQATSAGRDAYVAGGDLTVVKLFINLVAGNRKTVAFNRTETITVFAINFFICFALVIARILGVFEDIELAHYDHLLQSRAEVGMEDQLVIISASDRDYAQQDAEGESQKLGSYSDRELILLLQKVLLNNPKAVGLDIFRPYGKSADPLYSLLKQEDKVVLVCEVEGFSGEGLKAPDWIEKDQDRIGFNNFLYDYDQTVRRAYVGIEENKDSKCSSDFSFGFLLALKYLNYDLSEISSPAQIEDDRYNINILDKLLSPFYGAYQGIDSSGFQVLIDYKPVHDKLENLTDYKFDFSEVMDASFDANIFTEKIVLIGISAETVAPSLVDTPYGQTNRISVQAHIVSDFIARMSQSKQDDRTLTTASQPIILFFTFLMSSFSTILTIKLVNRQFLLVLFASFLEISLLLFSLIAMILFNIWIPILIIVISSIISIISTQVYGLSLAKDVK